MVAAVIDAAINGAFLRALCDTVTHVQPDAAHRALLGRMIADTLACAAAGFDQPTTRRALAALGGGGHACWSGAGCDSRESAILINAIAAHALDFDDVHLDSAIHPGVVLVPAVLTPAPGASDPDRVIESLAAGLVAAQAVAAHLGQGHYHRGWHGTGTIGTFAATAAAGRMAGLDAARMGAAFAMAAAMSGGLQANFGSDAKPAQAGFAAVAGDRAARLAAAGMTGAADPFDTPGGFAPLYGAADGDAAQGRAPDPDTWRSAPQGLAVKLYACCYAAHRLVALAQAARAALGPDVCAPGTSVHISAPAGSLAVLRYPVPTTPAQARFSAPYTVAAMLVDGSCGPQHFQSAPSARPDIMAMAARVQVTEDAQQQSGGDIRFGTVTLEVRRDGRNLSSFSRQAIPGTPEDPPDTEALRSKIRDCLSGFAAHGGQPLPILAGLHAMTDVAVWLPGASTPNLSETP